MLKKDIGSNVKSKPLSHSSYNFPNDNTLARTSTSEQVVSYRKCLCDRGFLFVTTPTKTAISQDQLFLHELKVNSKRKSLTRVLRWCFIKNVYPLYRKRVTYKIPLGLYLFPSSIYFNLLHNLISVGRKRLITLLNPKTESVSLRARRARGEPIQLYDSHYSVAFNSKKKSKKQRKCSECKKGYEYIQA